MWANLKHYWDSQNGSTIAVTADFHGMLAVHCAKFLPWEKDYNFVSCLGEENRVLMGQSMRQEVISPLTLEPLF